MSWLAAVLAGLFESAAAQVYFGNLGHEVVPVAAGASATLAFTLRNTGTSTETVALTVSGVGPDYGLAAQSECPVPAPSLSEDIVLAAGETRRCRYLLSRNALAAQDIRVVFKITRGNVAYLKYFRVGDLARLELSQDLLLSEIPANPNRVRVTVRNHGPTDVGRLRFDSCLAFESTQTLAVTGGECEIATSATCNTGRAAIGFAMSDLPAGTAKSCELQPGVQPASFTLALSELRKAGTDVVLENADTVAGAFGLWVPAGIDPHPIPAFGWLAGLALFGATAVMGRRRLS